MCDLQVRRGGPGGVSRNPAANVGPGAPGAGDGADGGGGRGYCPR